MKRSIRLALVFAIIATLVVMIYFFSTRSSVDEILGSRRSNTESDNPQADTPNSGQDVDEIPAGSSTEPSQVQGSSIQSVVTESADGNENLADGNGQGGPQGQSTSSQDPSSKNQGAPQQEKTAKEQSVGNNQSTKEPTSVPESQRSPDVKLEKDFKASKGEGTCDDQWSRHKSLFKQNTELVYLTNMAVQKPIAPEISIFHVEKIISTSANSVKRNLDFNSDHPTGSLVLSTIELPVTVNVQRDAFLDGCKSGKGRSVGLAGFNVKGLKVIDVTDETVQVGAGTFPAFKFKLEARITVGGKSVKTAAISWVSKKKTGLVIKQSLKIPSSVFPDHGSITFTSQLAGTKLLQ